MQTAMSKVNFKLDVLPSSLFYFCHSLSSTNY
uniref:Uncharacterized protein n=1 Tax=Arundo donax TaxID=35708 RepID=A0A0A9G731_ARUDO